MALRETFGTAGPIERYRWAGKTDPQIVFELMDARGSRAPTCSPGSPRSSTVTATTWHGGSPRPIRAPSPASTSSCDALASDPQVAVGLLTGNIRRGADIKLTAAGLAGYFTVGAFGSDQEDRNRLVAVARGRARERWGDEFPGTRTVVVGDAEPDIRCARAGGARAVAVASGQTTRETLARLQPDVLLDSLASPLALPALIRAGRIAPWTDRTRARHPARASPERRRSDAGVPEASWQERSTSCTRPAPTRWRCRSRAPRTIAVTVAGREVVMLTSNNYLGLANHPRVRQARDQGDRAVGRRHGLGALHLRHAARCTSELEETISAFYETDDTILYTSCWNANEAVLRDPHRRARTRSSPTSSTTPRSSTASGSPRPRRYIYRHNDMDDLEAKLAHARPKGARFILVITDGVFSMEGELAPLPRSSPPASATTARCSSSTTPTPPGCSGTRGRGTAEELGVWGKVPIHTGTLGKAMGSAMGGYVTGPRAGGRHRSASARGRTCSPTRSRPPWSAPPSRRSGW